MRLHRFRSGEIEVQFNWIFILIAGATILILFSSIIIKQKSSAETSSHATLLKTISTIVVGLESSPGVTQTYDRLPKATVQFECNLIRIESQSAPFQQMMLFAPSEMSMPPAVSLTREWSVPFRATNVVYLSSPKIRYLLVGDGALATSINKSFPRGLSLEWYNTLPSGITPRGDDATRFIFFADSLPPFPPSFEKEENKEVSALTVSGDEKGGKISYYVKIQGRWEKKITYAYLGEEMLLGAIFADSPQQYDCVAKNMLNKLDLVVGVYSERTSELELSTSPKISPCRELYTDARSRLLTLKGVAGGRLDEGTVVQAKAAMVGLETINSQLQRKSCPLLY